MQLDFFKILIEKLKMPILIVYYSYRKDLQKDNETGSAETKEQMVEKVQLRTDLRIDTQNNGKRKGSPMPIESGWTQPNHTHSKHGQVNLNKL